MVQGATACKLYNSTATVEEVIPMSSGGREVPATIHTNVAMVKYIMWDWVQYVDEFIRNMTCLLDTVTGLRCVIHIRLAECKSQDFCRAIKLK